MAIGDRGVKPRIVVANRTHDDVRDLLGRYGDLVVNPSGDPWSRAALLEHCREADAVMAFMTETIDADFVDACPRLRIVAGALKGYNNIDRAALSRRGIYLTIVPDLLTQPTAELAIGLMIAVARNILPGDRHVRSGDFQGWRPAFYGGSLEGSTVGVIGAGAVGRAVLRMLAGFDCHRLYHDREPLEPSVERSLDARWASLDTLRRSADFLVLALHLTPETLHLVDRKFIAGMKPGAYLINPARGSVVDEAAVAAALASGQLRGYAADTFEMEDWTLDHRPRAVHADLLASDRTVLTPHIGSAVARARHAIESEAAAAIIECLEGGAPAASVNLGDFPASLTTGDAERREVRRA